MDNSFRCLYPTGEIIVSLHFIMGFIKLAPKQKLIATICISFAFFVAEIAVAFYTGSLALLADAFHYMNDLIGFIVALAAMLISEHAKSPQDFSFGWARAQLLGAFFNGVFLLALGVSIFLQTIERFISIEHVENPKLVLIMGCIGLTLNIISAVFLHGDHAHHGHAHGHSHGHSHAHAHAFGHSHGDEEVADGQPVPVVRRPCLDDGPPAPLAHLQPGVFGGAHDAA